MCQYNFEKYLNKIVCVEILEEKIDCGHTIK